MEDDEEDENDVERVWRRESRAELSGDEWSGAERESEKAESGWEEGRVFLSPIFTLSRHDKVIGRHIKRPIESLHNLSSIKNSICTRERERERFVTRQSHRERKREGGIEGGIKLCA